MTMGVQMIKSRISSGIHTMTILVISFDEASGSGPVWSVSETDVCALVEREHLGFDGASLPPENFDLGPWTVSHTSK